MEENQEQNQGSAACRACPSEAPPRAITALRAGSTQEGAESPEEGPEPGLSPRFVRAEPCGGPGRAGRAASSSVQCKHLWTQALC